MISRVAENAFWLARYLERVETLARMLYVNTNFVLDVNLEGASRWLPLVVVVGEEKPFLASVPKGEEDDGETVQHFLTWERGNPASLAASLDSARENARTIRETISLEMWETLNGLWLWFNSKEAERMYQGKRYDFYQHLRDQCVLFQGFALDTMLQSEAYNFMRLGSSLERAGQTARILDVKHHALGPTGRGTELPSEVAQWQATLRSCSGIEPFFKASAGEMSGLLIVDFLLFDKFFPRSVTRSLDRAWNFMQMIRPRGNPSIGRHAGERLKSLRAQMHAFTIDDVVEHGLHKTLTWIVDAVGGICLAVSEDFFLAPVGTVQRRKPPSQRNASQRNAKAR